MKNKQITIVGEYMSKNMDEMMNGKYTIQLRLDDDKVVDRVKASSEELKNANWDSLDASEKKTFKDLSLRYGDDAEYEFTYNRYYIRASRRGGKIPLYIKTENGLELIPDDKRSEYAKFRSKMALNAELYFTSGNKAKGVPPQINITALGVLFIELPEYATKSDEEKEAERKEREEQSNKNAFSSLDF